MTNFLSFMGVKHLNGWIPCFYGLHWRVTTIHRVSNDIANFSSIQWLWIFPGTGEWEGLFITSVYRVGCRLQKKCRIRNRNIIEKIIKFHSLDSCGIHGRHARSNYSGINHTGNAICMYTCMDIYMWAYQLLNRILPICSKPVVYALEEATTS